MGNSKHNVICILRWFFLYKTYQTSFHRIIFQHNTQQHFLWAPALLNNLKQRSICLWFSLRYLLIQHMPDLFVALFSYTRHNNAPLLLDNSKYNLTLIFLWLLIQNIYQTSFYCINFQHKTQQRFYVSLFCRVIQNTFLLRCQYISY